MVNKNLTKLKYCKIYIYNQGVLLKTNIKFRRANDLFN